MSADAEMDIQRTLGRIEGKLDTLDERTKLIYARSNSHASRITRLEVWKTRSTAYFVGGSVVLSGLLSVAYKVLFLAK